MAAEGSEFEGILGLRRLDLAQEREDSESYVFVERRESDESSVEDLHVVERADPSCDESIIENFSGSGGASSPGGDDRAGDLSPSSDQSAISESYVEISEEGSGGCGNMDPLTEDGFVAEGVGRAGIEEELSHHVEETSELGGNGSRVMNVETGNSLGVDDHSSGYQEQVSKSSDGVLKAVESLGEQSGEFGQVDVKIDTAGHLEVEDEQGNDDIVVSGHVILDGSVQLSSLESSFLTAQERHGAALQSLDLVSSFSSSEKIVEGEAIVGETKSELFAETAEGRELDPSDVQDPEEQMDSFSIREEVEEKMLEENVSPYETKGKLCAEEGGDLDLNDAQKPEDETVSILMFDNTPEDLKRKMVRTKRELFIKTAESRELNPSDSQESKEQMVSSSNYEVLGEKVEEIISPEETERELCTEITRETDLHDTQKPEELSASILISETSTGDLEEKTLETNSKLFSETAENRELNNPSDVTEPKEQMDPSSMFEALPERVEEKMLEENLSPNETKREVCSEIIRELDLNDAEKPKDVNVSISMFETSWEDPEEKIMETNRELLIENAESRELDPSETQESKEQMDSSSMFEALGEKVEEEIVEENFSSDETKRELCTEISKELKQHDAKKPEEECVSFMIFGASMEDLEEKTVETKSKLFIETAEEREQDSSHVLEPKEQVDSSSMFGVLSEKVKEKMLEKYVCPDETRGESCTGITRELALNDAQKSKEETVSISITDTSKQDLEEKTVQEGVCAIGQMGLELCCEMAEIKASSDTPKPMQEDPNPISKASQVEAQQKPPGSFTEYEESGREAFEMVHSQHQKMDESIVVLGDVNADGQLIADSTLFEVVTTLSQGEAGETTVKPSIVDFLLEENTLKLEDDVQPNKNEILCLDTVGNRAICLLDMPLPLEQTDFICKFSAMPQEYSKEQGYRSSTNEELKPGSETGNQVALLVADSQDPTLKKEHGDVNTDHTTDVNFQEHKHAEMVELSTKTTGQVLDHICANFTFQPSHTDEEKIIALEDVQTYMELALQDEEIRQLSANADQASIGRPGFSSSVGCLGAEETKEQPNDPLNYGPEKDLRGVEVLEHEEPSTKTNDNTETAVSYEFEEQKCTELVAEKPLNIEKKNHYDSTEISHKLSSCLSERELSISEGKFYLELVENREMGGNFSDMSMEMEKSVPLSTHDTTKEVVYTFPNYEEPTSTSLRTYDELLTLQGIEATEVSEHNQETPRVVGNTLESTEDREADHQNVRLDFEVISKASDKNLNVAEPPSSSDTYYCEKEREMETQVHVVAVDLKIKADRDTEGGKQAEFIDTHAENFETMVHDTNEAVVVIGAKTQLGKGLPFENEKDGHSTNAAPSIPCSIDYIKPERETPCSVNYLKPEMSSSDNSVVDTSIIVQNVSENLAPGFKSSHTSIQDDDLTSSVAQNLDSSVLRELETGSGIDVADYTESLAAVSMENEELKENIDSDFVKDQPHVLCQLESKELKDNNEIAVQDRNHNHMNEEAGNASVCDVHICENEDITQSMTIFLTTDGSIKSCEDTIVTLVDGVDRSPTHADNISEAKRVLILVGEPEGSSVPQDQCLSMDGDKEDIGKENGVFEDVNDNSMQEAADGLGKDARFYIIRVRRHQDDKLASRIELSQLLVEEKTQNRDAVRTMIGKQKAICEEVWKSVEELRKGERAARQDVASKYQKLRYFREKIDTIELLSSIDDTDDKMNFLKHRIQHETIPLKEEKQLLQKIRALKLKREDLSSKLPSQADIEKALERKDQIQDMLDNLMPELDGRKRVLLQAEEKAKAAKKKYDDECFVLRNLQKQHRDADDERQTAYVHLRSLRQELNQKNVHFYKYKDDARIAANILSSGNKEELQRHCCNQVERFMELWNNDDEFRSQYVNSNQFSIMRRFGTFDGRSLGRDEESAVLLHAPVGVASDHTFPPLKSSPPLTVERNQDAKSKVLISERFDKSSIKTEKVVKQDKQKNPPKITSDNATAPVPTEESKNGNDEKDTRRDDEDMDKSLADELAKKEQEEPEISNREQAAAELKDKIRLEQIAKAREAEERKRKKAEKAKIMAEIRAQREAELREKKKAKKERLKEKKASATTEGTIANTEGTESLSSSSPEAVELAETKAPRSLPVPFRQQNYNKTKALQLPYSLRNRGKRKMQTWVWILVCAMFLGVLLYIANHASSRGSSSLSF